jgi:hypothetical protein
MITNKNIYLEVKKTSSAGYKKPTIKKEELKTVADKLLTDKLTQDDIIIMTEYAKWLPAGNRKLVLNMKELKETLLSNQLLIDPLNKVSGNNRGGNISLKLRTQGEYTQRTIENKNRLKTNPNYTSFKNHIKLK